MCEFSGNPKTEWLSDGRDMLLIEDLSFTDNRGRVWLAKNGSLLDGASIPRFFWRFLGGPFSGKYRRASILHDYAYITRQGSRKECDKMFKEAMLCDSVPRWKASLMYRAVRWFGPKW